MVQQAPRLLGWEPVFDKSLFLGPGYEHLGDKEGVIALLTGIVQASVVTSLRPLSVAVTSTTGPGSNRR